MIADHTSLPSTADIHSARARFHPSFPLFSSPEAAQFLVRSPLTKIITLELFLDVVPILPRMSLVRCVDSRSEFLKTTLEEIAGTSFYMFGFRFVPERFSALSAAFFYGRAFVCFSARLAVHYFAIYSVLGS